MEAFGYMVFYFLIFIAAGYYFFFGGKEKLKRFLFERKGLAEKAEMIMKQDFSPKYARASFYIGNNYRHKMCQADWQEYCKERIDPSIDKNSQEYAEAVAPIVNAIAVNADGYYLRRGMEDLEHSLQRFMPGVNDRISLNYFAEPYSYVENKKLAAASRALEEERERKRQQEGEANAPVRASLAAQKEAEKAAQKAARAERYRAEDAALKAKMEQEKKDREAARRRCQSCKNQGKCGSVQFNTGTCGGFTPR